MSSQAIRHVIQEEAERGAAILLTTHDMAEADKLSDRVAFIDEGRVLVTDTPENLKLTYGNGRCGSGRVTTARSWRPSSTSRERAERIRQAVAAHELLTIHTQEATLEEIFIHFAGERARRMISLRIVWAIVRKDIAQMGRDRFFSRTSRCSVLWRMSRCSGRCRAP